MQADEILKAIRAELGDPSCGAIVDNWALIEKAVRESMAPAGSHKETRIIKATEIPETP